MSILDAHSLKHQPAPLRYAVLSAMVLLWYVVMLGGTAVGEIAPWLRLINAAVGLSLLVLYVTRLPGRADRVDRGVLAAVILFAIAGVFSMFPRQSMDAVLAASIYGAAFFLAREITGIGGAQGLLTLMLRTLSVLITVIVALAWVPPFIEWWVLAGGTVPPLDLNLRAWPWGHRHDLALLAVMLYPSWWIGWRQPSFRRRALLIGTAAAVGIADIVIVLIDGSRTLWLAIAIASLCVVVPAAVRALRDRPSVIGPIVVGLFGAGAVLVLSGVAGSVVQRVVTGDTLAARSAMWSSLTDAWLTRPLSGLGPGSFPWVLQQTSYFDVNNWAPRHPDSVIFQLLPEAGLLGIGAIGCLAVVVVPRLVRAPAAGQWALITFAVAGIAASPTDFGFLIATAIAWAAICMPRPRMSVEPRRPSRTVRVAALAAVAMISVVGSGAVGATFAYEAAVVAASSGRIVQAGDHLDLAVALDPGMALYRRQRGTASLLLGNPTQAIADLQRSTTLNPSDDLAWRTLSLAHEAAGDGKAAAAALGEAMAVQRSDPTNLVLALQRHALDGNRAAALALASDLIQSWPAVVSAHGWRDLVSPQFSNDEAIAKAITRWSQGSPAPTPFRNQALWLVVLGGRPDLSDHARRISSLSPNLTDLTMSVLTCSADASERLGAAPDPDRRESEFWALKIMESARAGAVDMRAVRAYEIMTGTQLGIKGEDDLNPLAENGGWGFSADNWGYRRSTIDWPDYGPKLPSPASASIQWMLSPDSAVIRAGLSTATCRGERFHSSVHHR